jgi:amino acid adenylation domain-containing protein
MLAFPGPRSNTARRNIIHPAQPVAVSGDLVSLLDFPPAWADRQAFVSNQGARTFAEARENALRYCRVLRERHGVGPGERVGLCLPKCFEAAELIWGILAAGAAYVPVQFQGPPARLNAILRSTGPRLLLTTAAMASRLAADSSWPGLPVCSIEPVGSGEEPSILAGIAPASGHVRGDPGELAAIYFTSGSTGDPKGVMLSGASIRAALNLIIRDDEMSGEDRLVSHTSLHYAAYDLFLPFATGCRVFLLSDREALLPAGLARALEREKITVWRSTVTGLRLLLESGELAARHLGALRLLGIFGERLPVPLLRQLRALLPACRFGINYGATEAYRIASFDAPREIPDDLLSLPIGELRPEYILSLRDEDDREAMDGEVGEICIEGAPVLLGYWNDPLLTAARQLSGRRHTWRSGDFGYRDANGLLRLVGRRDQMVKIRGHRFDLGEVENLLRNQPGVRDAFAVFFEGSGVYAAVLAEADGIRAPALQRTCANALPIFARPSRIAFLEAFPTLPTGKLDRMALRTRLAEEVDRARRIAGE